MLLPLLCILLADVVAMFLLADVIAIVCVLFGWWQMLLPLWLLFVPLVGMLYHFMADVIAIFVGWCYCHAFVAVFVADVMATVADGIAIYKTDVIGRCYLPEWQIE